MELEGKHVLEEREDAWLLIDNYMGKTSVLVDKNIDKMSDELPEVYEEVKITPIAEATTTSSSPSNSADTYLTMIVTAALFLFVLNIAYLFRALVFTPSGASTFLVACLNALGAWSILNAASNSSLVSCQAGGNGLEERQDLIAPEIPAPEIKQDGGHEEENEEDSGHEEENGEDGGGELTKTEMDVKPVKGEPTTKNSTTLPLRNTVVPTGHVTGEGLRDRLFLELRAKLKSREEEKNRFKDARQG